MTTTRVSFSVRDLSRRPSPRPGAPRSRSTASPSTSAKGEDRGALWAESGSGKSVDWRCRSSSCCNTPRPRHPSGEIVFQGAGPARGLRDGHHERSRGADITMVFQEADDLAQPPLHVISKQIGRDPAAAFSRCPRRRARGAHAWRCSSGVGIRRWPPRRLDAYSPPALRRPAPARDDRHGARQRPGPAESPTSRRRRSTSRCRRRS